MWDYIFRNKNKGATPAHHILTNNNNNAFWQQAITKAFNARHAAISKRNRHNYKLIIIIMFEHQSQHIRDQKIIVVIHC